MLPPGEGEYPNHMVSFVHSFFTLSLIIRSRACLGDIIDFLRENPDRVQHELKYDCSLWPIADNSNEDVQVVTDIVAESILPEFPPLVLLMQRMRHIQVLQIIKIR
jgi:hypothetical protein